MTVQAANNALPLLHQRPAFDEIAQDYDRIFTHSILGKAQRSLVHEALRGYFHEGQRVLDLNCGTGEDAIHLASMGLSVLACDVSKRMLDVARIKAAGHPFELALDFAVCANEDLGALQDRAPFDGVLSNFGGLNCTADLAGVARSLAHLVRPGGEVFLCLLGPFCAWEIFWYSVRAQWCKAVRRMKRGGSEAKIGGAGLRVYYPAVREIRNAFASSFELVSWRGVGVVLPPSWMEPLFQHRPALVNLLTRVDRKLGRVPVFRGVADHILFHFVREGK
jgi:ubiquinone/menaquinone biosynthesis C-methylase UbiE